VIIWVISIAAVLVIFLFTLIYIKLVQIRNAELSEGLVKADEERKGLHKQVKSGVLLGQILKNEGFCTDEDILKALDKQRLGDKRLLGEILCDIGVLTEEDLAKALEIQHKK